jgi:hypothetical protein
MSKFTGQMGVKSKIWNLGINGAFATCPRKSAAPLDRFWSVTEHAGCYRLQLQDIRKQENSPKLYIKPVRTSHRTELMYTLTREKG